MAGGKQREREAVWREVIREQETSGLSITAFCRKRSVSEGSFYKWRKHLLQAQTEDSANRFVPVEIGRPMVLSSGLEVVLGNGRRIVVPPEFDAQALRELVAVLEETQPC